MGCNVLTRERLSGSDKYSVQTANLAQNLKKLSADLKLDADQAAKVSAFEGTSTEKTHDYYED